VRRILTIIVDLQLRHPVAVLLTAVLLTALSLWYTFGNLEFQTGQKDLIYPDNRLVKLSQAVSAFDEYDTFVVVIENRDVSRSLSFLHTLVPLLEQDKKHYRQVFYRVDPERFKPWALLYLKRKDLVRLGKDLRDHAAFLRDLAASPGVATVLKETNHEMASSMVGELFTGFLDETSGEKKKPMDLTFVIRLLTQMQHNLDNDKSFVSPWESFFTGTSWDEKSNEGYFWTKGKRFLLLFVSPRATDGGFSNTLQSLERLRRIITRVGKTFPGIRAGVTGQEALNQDEMGTALHDISLATILSLAGLAVLLTIFWRGFRRPLLELVELTVALSWTFGLTTLFIGHLNILSVIFTPLLLGLGIDYGIHWLARYQEEVQQMGKIKEEAVRATMLRLGPSLVLAGLTGAVSFFPLVLTGFKGLVELGEITSMGMVMTTVTTLCLLPALIMIFDKATPKDAVSAARRPRILFRLNTGGAAAILVTAGLAFVLSLWFARHVGFDLNMLHLQSRDAESVIWEHKLLDGSNRSSAYGAMLARSLEEIRKKTHALEALATVSEVQSVLSMLPEHQEEKIRILQEMKPVVAGTVPFKTSDTPVNIAELDDILGRIRFKMLDSKASEWGAAKPLAVQMRQVRVLIDGLRKRFRSTDAARLAASLKTFDRRLMRDLQDKLETLRMNVNAAPMQAKDLPLSLRQRYISRDGRYLMRIFPSGDIWQPAFLNRFVHDLQSVDPNAVGDPVTLDIFTRAFRNGCIEAAVYAVIFISLLLLFTFRNVFQAFLVMTPLIMGTAWTLGLMDLFGIDFNLANSLFLPLIVGAGVEYGIIILQRSRQEGLREEKMGVRMSTAKGVILAGLTTTVGFGSLIISQHRGISSLGLLATIGSLSILTAAVIFLPALMQAVRIYLNRLFLKKRG
jgi:hopanoid biosynthesis associated RND transporter like protein HpnN